MFLSQVSSALHYLHENHVVHGDLRAEYVNVLAPNKVRSAQIRTRARILARFLVESLLKRVLVHNLSCGNPLNRFMLHVHCLANSFPYESFCSRTRFEKEAKSKSEMAYSANDPTLSHTTHIERFLSEQICF